ncbi:MAG TPA: hypothetical protein VKU01_28965 [Bryobacteraceae bacterium]|nr:hypothetical protein [Bryobacteraceae bacterium]
MDDAIGLEQYVRRVLEAYRKTPGTTGTIRRPDRMLAAQLFHRGISLSMVENALVLAATRRLIRRADAPPLGTVRSLAYFLPVIEEVLELRVKPDYFQYLRQKLQRISPNR